jgi:hypothetical protein
MSLKSVQILPRPPLLSSQLLLSQLLKLTAIKLELTKLLEGPTAQNALRTNVKQDQLSNPPIRLLLKMLISCQLKSKAPSRDLLYALNHAREKSRAQVEKVTKIIVTQIERRLVLPRSIIKS